MTTGLTPEQSKNLDELTSAYVHQASVPNSGWLKVGCRKCLPFKTDLLEFRSLTWRDIKLASGLPSRTAKTMYRRVLKELRKCGCPRVGRGGARRMLDITVPRVLRATAGVVMKYMLTWETLFRRMSTGRRWKLAIDFTRAAVFPAVYSAAGGDDASRVITVPSGAAAFLDMLTDFENARFACCGDDVISDNVKLAEISPKGTVPRAMQVVPGHAGEVFVHVGMKPHWHVGTSGLHTDAYAGILWLLRGAKTIRMISSADPLASHLGVVQPGEARMHPSCPFSEGWGDEQGWTTVQMVAGDSLLIPAGWWHQVLSTEPLTVAVAFDVEPVPPPPALLMSVCLCLISLVCAEVFVDGMLPALSRRELPPPALPVPIK